MTGDFHGSRILIAGAGYVGTLLGTRLRARGARVFACRRDPASLHEALEPVVLDLCDSDSVSHLPERLDYVVYALSPDSSDEHAYERAYLRALQNVIHAPSLEAHPPRRIVFTSSTAVYGQSDGSWVDEHSETQPMGFSGRCLLKAEALLAQAQSPHCIVRFAGIYGPGRERLLTQARSGSASFASPSPFTNRIHRDDCAAAIEHALGLAHPDRVYLGVDDEPATLQTVLEWLCERVGSPPPSPDGIQRSRGGNKRCSNHRLRESGFEPSFPSFRDGYQALIDASGS